MIGAWILVIALGGAAWAGVSVEAIPPHPLPGEVFTVVIRGAEAASAVEVGLDGRTFPAWRDEGRWEALVAAERDADPGSRDVAVTLDGAGEPATLLLKAPVMLGQRHDPEQRLTVSERMVTLSQEDQDRAAREAARIASALGGRSPARLWEGAFRVPTDGPVSSPFGVRRFYNGKPRSYHSGLDIASPQGTPVRSPEKGRVALIGDFFYTGNTVLLDHGLGLITAFFHLESVAVREGQVVAPGTTLGRVGSTGRSTGAQLHWGVYVAGVKVDPMSLLRASGGAAGGGETP
jgi:murein DD-endopeptidase MepM/ murein hydrolase activator NlpD